jgi:hypothetical protein
VLVQGYGTMDEPIDELDIIDLRQLQAIEIHSWRKRQPKFCYPVTLAADIGTGPAAALYFILCAIARTPIIRDPDIVAATGSSPADIAAARAYAQQCGFLQAAELASGVWKYELHLVAFSEWAERWR